MLLLAQYIQSKSLKGMNPNNVNKGDKVKHGGKGLIISHS